MTGRLSTFVPTLFKSILENFFVKVKRTRWDQKKQVDLFKHGFYHNRFRNLACFYFFREI